MSSSSKAQGQGPSAMDARMAAALKDALGSGYRIGVPVAADILALRSQ